MSRIRKLRGMITEPAPGEEGFPFPPWQRPSRPAPKVRNVLSRERIVEVALQIIDGEGTEAVSMRRIATELGTGAASLYAYVSGKDEVLALAHELVIGQLTFPETAGQDWQSMLKSWARGMYELYAEHQDLARLSFADIPTGPRALDTAERVMRAMISGGVPPQLASWMVDRMALYVGADAFEGWVLAQRFAATDDADKRTPQERGNEWIAGVRDYFAALPRDRYPMLVEHVTAMTTGGGDQRFEFGLDLLIEGLAAMAARASHKS
ncbi:MAG: TetR/AcrR family transcriptional regulator [Actinomycetota bacterium]|nr:TetR/AcrR family transcriptional regulator [Actinomycetota bacterium]